METSCDVAVLLFKERIKPAEAGNCIGTIPAVIPDVEHPE